MDKLTLADIQALAASVDYGGVGDIAPSSAALGLSAALFLSDLSLWKGAGYSLTDDEIDDIKAMIAGLENDLMLTGDYFTVDRCQLTNNATQTVEIGTSLNVLFNVEVYDPQSMHSLIANTDRIYVQNDGLHLITGQISWENSSVGYRQMQLRKFHPGDPTAPAIALDLRSPVIGTGACTTFISVQDYAVAGDSYYLRLFHTSTVDLDINSHSYSPFFSAVRL